MKITHAPRLLLLAALVAVSSPAALVRAQEAAPVAAELPAARSVIDRYCTETGLAKKLAETSSLRVKGKAAVPAMGLEGSFERWTAKPGRSLVRVELPTVGRILSGSDGKTTWSDNPMTGAQILKGAELLQALAENAYDASLRPSASYQSIETTARREFAGEDCFEVRYVLKPLEGMDPETSRKVRTSYEYYSVESGRLLGMHATSASPTGPLDVVVKYSKFALMGEVLQPNVITQEVAGSQLVITIESVEYDQVKDEVFALPPSIRAMLEAPAPPQPKGADDNESGSPHPGAAVAK